MRQHERLKMGQRQAVALAIRDAALRLIHESGRIQCPPIGPGRELVYESTKLTIMLSMPFESRVGAVQRVLDIWPKGGRKVFSICWDPVKLIGIRYGTWMNYLIPNIFLDESEAGERLSSGH